MPELKGRLHGIAFRVPVATVSVVDLVADLKKEVTVEQVNKAFKEATTSYCKGILEFTLEPLVSMDFKGNPASSIVDGLSTMVIAGNLVKVLAWYDNEWGYSCRLGDLTAFIAGRGL
jgi:glyceraldehyde 3-phosphate dehydrogenase